MTKQQIEDANGTAAEINNLGVSVELATMATDYFQDEDGTVTSSLVLTPRQARALARQLLEMADEVEYGE